MMKAILLCGGLGTRLRPIIGEKQKAMADVKGKPFLNILIDYLVMYNIKDFVFACGYKKDEIENYFGNGKELGINIEYAVEEEPLGTGGAIKNCINYVDDEMIYVLNADTLFKANINDLYKNMVDNNTDLSIIVKETNKVVGNNEKNRYGNIKVKNNLIESFVEKPTGNENNTYINGGIYIIKKDLIKKIPDGKSSFENDLMPQWIKENVRIGAIVSNASFIDIGTPESYKEMNLQYE